VHCSRTFHLFGQADHSLDYSVEDNRIAGSFAFDATLGDEMLLKALNAEGMEDRDHFRTDSSVSLLRHTFNNINQLDQRGGTYTSIMPVMKRRNTIHVNLRSFRQSTFVTALSLPEHQNCHQIKRPFINTTLSIITIHGALWCRCTFRAARLFNLSL
jgi:hypothetical protein